MFGTSKMITSVFDDEEEEEKEEENKKVEIDYDKLARLVPESEDLLQRRKMIVRLAAGQAVAIAIVNTIIYDYNRAKRTAISSGSNPYATTVKSESSVSQSSSEEGQVFGQSESDDSGQYRTARQHEEEASASSSSSTDDLDAQMEEHMDKLEFIAAGEHEQVEQVEVENVNMKKNKLVTGEHKMADSEGSGSTVDIIREWEGSDE
jgi:hypothetical protein